MVNSKFFTNQPIAIMHFIKKNQVFSIMALAFIVLFSTPLKANPGGFSDEELEKFAASVTQVMTIQQQGQAEMISIIEDHEMTVERFNEIMTQTQEMPLEEVEATEEEKEIYQEVIKEIDEIQIELEARLIEAIEEEGLSIEKYEEIMQEYQQNPELQQLIQEMLQE